MSNYHTNVPTRGLVYLLLVLAAIVGSLFTIFTFVATAVIGEGLALILFIAVGGLILAGYMVGLMALSIAALVWLAKRTMKPRTGSSIEGSPKS